MCCKGNEIEQPTGGKTMRVYWWNGGVQVEPESDEDRQTLVAMVGALDRVRVGQLEPDDPLVVVEALHEQPVVAVDEGP